MASDSQVATLVAALQSVQTDVGGLLEKVSGLQNQLQQSQQQQQQSQQPQAVDLSQALAIVADIRSTLENTTDTVQTHVDNAQAPTSDQGGTPDTTSAAATGPASTDTGAASSTQTDHTASEQTIIGDGGEAVSGPGSVAATGTDTSSDPHNPTPVDNSGSDQ